MSGHSDSPHDRDALREKIIGLGERSVRKSYYPQLQRQLAELERFRALLDQSRDAILLAQIPSGRLIDVNESACRQLGYVRNKLLKLSVSDFVAPDAWERIRAMFSKEQIVAREGETITTWLYRKDGDIIPVEMTVRPVVFDDEVYAVVVARDIAERKRAEAERETLIAELEAKNAELERFVYTVSHDLKSPLITIRGFLGFVEQAALAGDVAGMKEDMARIAAAADKMQRLLDELLELSRIGRLVNPPEGVAFGELAREAVSLVEGRLQEQEVAVEIAPELLAPDGPKVYGDRPRLLEVLQNLVDNAIKYMGDQTEPRVEIGMRYDGGERVFFVRDNGIGIAPRYHERVFDLFEKLNPQAEGTGVGLTIVKRIVKVHGGRVWVESEGVGKGSTFCFTLTGL